MEDELTWCCTGLRLMSLGLVFGPILCVIIAVQHWFFLFLEVVQLRDEIDLVEGEWSRERFARVCPGISSR